MSTPLPRVAYVCPFGFRPKATVGARTLPMAKAMQSRGYDVRLFVPPWDDAAAVIGRSDVGGVPVEQVSVAGGLLPALRRLYGSVVAFQPDIVHFVKPLAYSAATAWLASWHRRIGRPVSLVLDTDDWEAEWLPRQPYPRWQKHLASRQERWSYAHADAVTAASEALATIALALRGSRGRVFTVPNAWPAPAQPAPEEAVAAKRREYGLGDDTVVLYTRFAEYPPEWPVAMLAALRHRRPEARLLVVGESLHGEGALFRRAVRGAGLEQAVVDVGWPGSEAARTCLAAGAVAIVPFADRLLARTKSSVKLLELMSLGVPLVASAVGENVHYLGYGEAGRLVAGLDPEVWAEKVAHLLQSPAERGRLSSAARRRLNEHFIWDKVATTVEEAYRSVWPR